MNTNSPIFFIYLLSNSPQAGEERYIFSFIRPSAEFHPTKLSSINIETIRREILFNIKNLKESDSIDYLRKSIGKKITLHLGLSNAFHHVFESKPEIDNITILTNDEYIPWEWAYDEETGKFLSESFNIGKVFLKNVEDYNSDNESKHALFENLVAFKEKARAVIFFDEGGYKYLRGETNKILEKLDTKEEADVLKSSLLRYGFKSEHIEIINGNEQNAEYRFITYLNDYKDTIKIIHYAGHIVFDSNEEIVLKFKWGKIQPSEIQEPFKRFKLAKPFVFLNACHSGTIVNTWKAEKNFTSSFISAGAANCLCTNRPIYDKFAIKFTKLFYDTLLNEKNCHDSIGSILKNVKNELAIKCDGYNLDLLNYVLHGYPYNVFSPIDLDSVSQIQSHHSAELDKLFAV